MSSQLPGPAPGPAPLQIFSPRIKFFLGSILIIEQYATVLRFIQGIFLCIGKKSKLGTTPHPRRASASAPPEGRKKGRQLLATMGEGCKERGHKQLRTRTMHSQAREQVYCPWQTVHSIWLLSAPLSIVTAHGRHWGREGHLWLC
jgi:hypothetical protein